MTLNIGQKVSFRGTRDSEGQMVSAHINGPDRFEAVVKAYPYGTCYALAWPDGQPVGLPFHDFQLTKEE